MKDNFILTARAPLTLSWERSLSYRNQSIDFQSKSMHWFLQDRDLRHESLIPSQTHYAFLTIIFFLNSKH